jgi:hypothetical protein
MTDILRPLSHFQFVRETKPNAQLLDRLTSEVGMVIHLAAVGVKLIVENPVDEHRPTSISPG